MNYYPDFSVYYYGAKVAFSGGNPYRGGINFFAPFVYPPFVLLFFYPLTFFSYSIAEKLWVSASIGFLFLSIFLLLRLFKQPFLSTKSLVLAALIFLSFPVKFTLGMGQINLLILLLVVLSIYCFLKGKDIYSGIFLAFSILLKLFPVLFLVYFLIKKKWSVLFSTLVTIGIMAFLVYICIPPKINHYFLTMVLPQTLGSWKGDYYNQSLSGFLLRGISDSFLREQIRVGLTGIILLMTFAVIVKKRPKNFYTTCLELSLLITISLLLNTFSWQHHFVWLLIPFFTVVFSIHKYTSKKQYSYYGMVFISYLLIATNVQHPLTIPIIFQSHVFYGTVLLYALLAHLLL